VDRFERLIPILERGARLMCFAASAVLAFGGGLLYRSDIGLMPEVLQE
jgi:hypothetical protein